MHAAELIRMGADIQVRGNSAVIRGVPSLSAAPVMASDLRASAALVLAGIAARGVTEIRRVYHLYRGYQQFDSKLNSLGARILRVDEGPDSGFCPNPFAALGCQKRLKSSKRLSETELRATPESGGPT
jgi:UDP-N-acetylglucosamine 1-carboxyvinyltransferase